MASPMGSCPAEDGAAPAIPQLRPSEKFHLFVSYSSVDAAWTHGLIGRLEADHAGLRVCLHERDFMPGRNVLENMADCIQRSQKVLLVLSQDFVQSRWCLLEADLSLFGSCLGCRVTLGVILILLSMASVFLPLVLGIQENHPARRFLLISANVFFCPLLMVLSVNTLCWFRRFSKRKMRELARSVGEANLLLAPHSVLMGCDTRNKLYFVYVLLGDCRQALLGSPENEALFQEALLQFSCSYACCLAHAHFPPCEDTVLAPGHLELGLCFCQFVFLQLKRRGGPGVNSV